MKLLDLIKGSLNEDIQTGDLTTNLLISDTVIADAKIMSKSPGVFCGDTIISIFQELYPNLEFHSHCHDGDQISANVTCQTIHGQLSEILKIERTLLNFLQRLSGISTITAKFVAALNDPSIQILDTRKTTPMLRQIEKEAVIAGGGYNHRIGLFDMILIKENHLHPYIKNNQMDQFNNRLRNQKMVNPSIQIEVEVASITELSLLSLDVIDIILFDNMPIEELNRCIDFCNNSNSKCLKEVSGNITLNSIKSYKGIDIDRISIGSLTHSVTALDLSLLIL